ncbi:hypothetical protein QTO34_015879 [Cnephaeus nilssonii]|uniref:Uncharacterized protein n=1 Tax=Cnephaeus nilssonii TaxID=3371016 RepID=A0AA40I566_CNENI|nr:hypothetical protein QTO34_015879 [Eptesicus nilssonii]
MGDHLTSTGWLAPRLGWASIFESSPSSMTRSLWSPEAFEWPLFIPLRDSRLWSTGSHGVQIHQAGLELKARLAGHLLGHVLFDESCHQLRV